MAKALVIASVCLGLLATTARAVDLKIKSTLEETFEVNDNRQMRVNPLGPSYNTISSLFFDAKALMPTSKFEFYGDLKYRTYAGPGEINTPNALDRSFNARFEKSHRLTTYNVFASYQEVESASLQLAETGIITRTGSTITNTVAGGLTHQLSPRDSIDWQTTWTSTTFTDPASTPLDSLTSLLTWTHKISPITSVTPLLQYQHLSFHNASETQVDFWKATVATKTRLTRTLTFKGEAGVALVNSTNNGIAGPNTASVPSGSAIDWLADASLIYRIKNVEFTLNASHLTAPTTFGQFLTKDTIGLFVGYDINTLSSIYLSAQFIHQTSAAGGNAIDRYDATITYSRLLAREWRTRLTYKYSQNNSDVGSPRSNAVLFALSRDVTILP